MFFSKQRTLRNKTKTGRLGVELNDTSNTKQISLTHSLTHSLLNASENRQTEQDLYSNQTKYIKFKQTYQSNVHSFLKQYTYHWMIKNCLLMVYLKFNCELLLQIKNTYIYIYIRLKIKPNSVRIRF